MQLYITKYQLKNTNMNNLNCQQTNEPALLQQKYQKKTIEVDSKPKCN